MSQIVIIGAGLSGSVLARELAVTGHRVDVFEARNHVAGNCHTTRDAATGIMLHAYGAHVFHTDNDRVWNYVRHFATFMPYIQRTKATVDGKVYSLPINLHTINQFFGRNMSPEAAKIFVNSKCSKIDTPRTFEDQALAFIGPELYEGFMRGYTRKQWGRDPTVLPASILARLPLRFDYNDNYFNHPHQGIPPHGYTDMVSAMLDHPAIMVHLDAPIDANDAERLTHDHIFYSGPLDAWFDHAYGRLAYRTLDFETFTATGDIQGCAVMNYCDDSVPYTRIVEHKHFTPWETHDRSIAYREFSREAEPRDEKFYPVRLADDKDMLAQYTARALGERRVTFIGRLGTYRYLDMHQAIGEALTAADKFLGRTP